MENALDLVQVRWQLIRSFECSRNLEAENMRLRQEIRSMQENASKNTTLSSSLQTIVLQLASKLQETLREMKEFKSATSNEISSTQRALKQIIQQHTKLKAKVISEANDVAYYKEEIEVLRRNLADAKTSISSSAKLRSDESEAVKAKLAKLQRDLADCEKEKEMYRKEALSQKYKLERELENKTALEGKIEVRYSLVNVKLVSNHVVQALVVEVKNLKGNIRNLENEKLLMIQQHAADRQKLIEQYEDVSIYCSWKSLAY
jgi:chromosome segregation ATPase